MASDAQSNKLYLYFWHPYSPVMYSLYEIDVPNPLPPPPTKDAQDEQIVNPNHLEPILQLKTGEYPGNMCCVSLGSKLYFMGGEYDIDYPCIDEDVKIKYEKVKRDIFPRDVYIFDPTTPSLLLHGTAMNSGKSWPLAFVADEKIYVLGSNFTTDIFDTSRRKDSELKSLSLFEVYHPKDDKWTILPNPPIWNVETSWVGHAVERRKVFFIASQPGKERLYCFDLDRGQWTKHITLPSHLCNVSGRIEVIDGTFYGCCHNTIAAIAPVAKEEEGEEEEEEEGEKREQKMAEEDELNIQQQQEEDEMGARFRNYRLHVVSREMGMNAIFNVPQQLHSSSSLLYLGNRCFCYVMTGMPPHPKYGSDHDAIEDDKLRVISIVLFQVLGETYKEDAIRPFKAKFLHSAHYAVKTPFPNEGIIHGCFSLGWESQQPQIEEVGGLQGCHTQAMGKFQTQYQAERSLFDKQELGSNILVAAGRDHAEASARSTSIGGGEFLVPPIDVSDSGTGNSSSQRQRSRRDDGERWTLTVPVPRIGNTEIPLEDGSKYPSFKQDQQTKASEPKMMAISNLGENIKINTEIVNKACYVAMGAHNSADKPYILQNIRGSPDLVIFGFPGNWSVNDWYAGESFGETEINLELFPSLRSIGIDEHAKVNKAFLQRFGDKVLTNSDFTNKVQKAVTEKKQILFTGHSTGGSIANLATIWFLEKYLRSDSADNYKISPSSLLCVTFGCPLTGNHIFSHALRRENWACYFIHFVMRYDIVPRILLAPVSSILLEFQRVLQFLNEKSINLAHASINNFDASNFYMKVMKNASNVASHAACNFMGNTNLLLETETNFIPLSPYKPFGTYVFCTGNGKLVILRNPDAVLQLLFYSSQLCKDEECIDVAQRTLQQHFSYESELQESFQMQNEVYLEPLEQLPLSAESTSDTATINAALNDLGLSTRARLCLCAAGEVEKRKIGNKDSIDLKKTDIEKAMKYLLEDYQLDCGHRGLGCYDAFKLQESSKDFDANVKRLELAGIWDEIVELLKRYELPDAFEGQKDWIDLGTRYRRLVEPLDITNYYRHSKNEDTGAYMHRGRPKRYKFTQRWFENAKRMPAESSWESCFWAKVEELRIKTSNVGGFAQVKVKEEVLKLEEQVQIWIKGGELGKDVFLEKSTFMKWWNTLPEEHKSKSCIKNVKDS